MDQSLKPNPGSPTPWGATQAGPAVNFSFYAPKADKARLAIYSCGQEELLGTFEGTRTGDHWHVAIEGLPDTFDYNWFLEGTQKSPRDIAFDPNRPLADPFAHTINTSTTWRGVQPRVLRARYVTPKPFDWEDVRKPSIPYEQLIIYEMHVRSFTADKSSHCAHPGTYSGIIDKIPYLRDLGINAVELMPIYEFDETAYQRNDPVANAPLCNYWGYSTMNFFCPMKRFASSQEPAAAIQEFKTLVRELHKAGIEVILDVVYNHTAESPEHIFTWKGIDNSAYYLLEEDGKDKNYSGTGNTFACNSPPSQEMILESLRYWAEEMQVDGFRFDLASILTRGENGAPLEKPPLLQAMAEDPRLRSVKFIAEGWDAAGLYQLGQFPMWGPWSEWNGKFRDNVRRFIKGTDGLSGAFAGVLCGSQDLYGKYPLGPLHSVNFVTCHDGFTLHDLVSYQGKHNERNGEENRDGTDQNDSWNCGAEGTTHDPKVKHLREQQMRNFHLALMLSLGIPMVLMGDEYGHSRQGNNNAWCQDNELNWFDWHGPSKNPAFFRFFRKLITLRRTHPFFRRKKFYTGHDIVWQGTHHCPPDWSEKSRFVAATLNSGSKQQLFFAFNAHYEPIPVVPPTLKHNLKWYRLIDTALSSPEDFTDHPHPVHGSTYTLQPHAAILFETK